MKAEIDQINERYLKGYTMSVHGTREAVHNQMNQDIKTLLNNMKLIYAIKEMKL